MIQIYLVSLGCPKNLIDSEHMLSLIQAAGMKLTDDPAQADVAVVNTCGFIADAQSEAIDTILSLAPYKAEGRMRAILVAGCLAERFREEVLRELPEADGILGTGSYHEIVPAIREVLVGGRPVYLSPCGLAPLEGERTTLLTPNYSSYLKIAEGCDNHCAYCVIPSLRGPFRSRPLEALSEEARALAERGTRELLIVAQDVTRYGTDLYGRRALCELLRALCAIDKLHWIRLHYLYPDELDDELIDLIAREKKVLPYFDIPIQHIDDRLLARMNRRGDSALIRGLLEKIRRRIPDAALRTSLIVGLPGEGEEEFSALCSFLKEERLPRAGVFSYSPEEGSPAASMDGQVSEEEKKKRQDIVQELQSRVIDDWNQSMLGRELEILVEGFDEETSLWQGRSYADAPEIDGRVLFSADSPLCAGMFVPVRITDAYAFDLIGEMV